MLQFNLSTMLNLKSLWMHLAKIHPNQSIQKINKGSMNFAWSSYMEIWMSKGLVKPEYTYHQQRISRNCCGHGVLNGAAKACKGNRAFS